MSRTRPNILFVLADDHAANAISAYGSLLAGVFQTPNLDRIASAGVRLDRCFCTNAICTPSRASILTGQHSHKCGVRTLSDALDPDADTLVRRMQGSGYQTGLFGKWHVHCPPAGFDDFRVLPGQGIYFDPHFIGPDDDWEAAYAPHHSEGGTRHNGYVTDLVTDFTLDWLRNRDRDRPFLACCHHKAPHDDFEYHPRHEHFLDGVDIPEPANLWEDHGRRDPCTRHHGTSVSDRNPVRNAILRMSDPAYPTGPLDVTGLDAEGRTRAAYQKYLKDYLRCCAAIDENVGRLLDFLEEDGVADDTLVVYTSDQGMFLGEHDYIDKRWIYDEAMRMPMLVSLPREIPPGSVNADVVSNVDIASTLLDYAEAPVSEEVQGRSFRSNLRGETDPDWPQRVYYRYWMHMAHHHNPAHYGLRTQRYKLIHFYGLPLDATDALPGSTPPGWEFYDLEVDPAENVNRYADPAYAAVIAELKLQLLEEKRRLGDEDECYPEMMSLPTALTPK